MSAKHSQTVTLTDVGDALGRALGVKIDTASIVAKVKENTARLDSCDLHNFAPKDAKPNLNTKYVCARCGGEVDAARVAWYVKGIEHARKAVMP